MRIDSDEIFLIPFTTVRLIEPIVIDALNEPLIRTSLRHCEVFKQKTNGSIEILPVNNHNI